MRANEIPKAMGVRNTVNEDCRHEYLFVERCALLSNVWKIIASIALQ